MNKENKSQPIISAPFRRPRKYGTETYIKVPFEEKLPAGGNYWWEIGRKSETHSNSKGRMRFRVYAQPVEGTQPLPEEWIKAGGVAIRMKRRNNGTTQYPYEVEPLQFI